jgi:segregation and condensation protein B
MIREENVNCTVEAVILASPEPLSVKKICDALDDVTPARVRQAVGDLNNIYLGCGNSFRIREIAGGYQFYILPDFERPVRNLLAKERAVRLSRAALETLAIIAYKQPVTKTEIEHIRGVAADGVIHNLLQRNMLIIAGRADTAGRPLLYKTSGEFLKFFGLNRLSDLPRLDEIEEMIRQSETPKEQFVLPLNGRQGSTADSASADESGIAEFADDGYDIMAVGEVGLETDVDSDELDEFETSPSEAGDNGDGHHPDSGDIAALLAKTLEAESLPDDGLYDDRAVDESDDPFETDELPAAEEETSENLTPEPEGSDGTFDGERCPVDP